MGCTIEICEPPQWSQGRRTVGEDMPGKPGLRRSVGKALVCEDQLAKLWFAKVRWRSSGLRRSVVEALVGEDLVCEACKTRRRVDLFAKGSWRSSGLRRSDLRGNEVVGADGEECTWWQMVADGGRWRQMVADRGGRWWQMVADGGRWHVADGGGWWQMMADGTWQMMADGGFGVSWALAPADLFCPSCREVLCVSACKFECNICVSM